MMYSNKNKERNKTISPKVNLFKLSVISVITSILPLTLKSVKLIIGQ
jgi:hypothetical protein